MREKTGIKAHLKYVNRKSTIIGLTKQTQHFKQNVFFLYLSTDFE